MEVFIYAKGKNPASADYLGIHTSFFTELLAELPRHRGGAYYGT